MAYKSKALRDWEAAVREHGCVITRETNVQLHHVYGRTYRNNKVLIGPWYILPLSPRLHDVGSNDPCNVTHFPKKFAEHYGNQKDLFLEMCDSFRTNGIIIPFNTDVINSIRLTAR